jgi:hypothetical protein
MQVARGALDQNRDGAAADGAVFNEFVVALGGVNLGGVTLAAPRTINKGFLEIHEFWGALKGGNGEPDMQSVCSRGWILQHGRTLIFF